MLRFCAAVFWAVAVMSMVTVVWHRERANQAVADYINECRAVAFTTTNVLSGGMVFLDEAQQCMLCNEGKLRCE